MSLVNFLNTEYAFILGEVKKKHAELRKCTEDAIALLKEFKPPTETASPTDLNLLVMAGERSAVLVRPFLLALDPKQSRLFAQMLVCISRLVSQTVFPTQNIDELTVSLENALGDTANNADNALRIIQISMGIVLNYPQVTGTSLVRCFTICIVFSNQPSGKGKQLSSDIINAASVTLRQIAMTCVSKLKSNPNPEATTKVRMIGTADGGEAEMNTFVADVYQIINDMAGCVLGEKSVFLQLELLHITHCLEMIESLLAGNATVLARSGHQLVTEAVRDNLLPALVKKFGEKHNYPVYLRILRIFRIVFVDYFESFGTICHVIVELVLKDMREHQASWQHILCFELIKGFLLENADGLRKMLSFECLKLFHSFLSIMLENLDKYHPGALGQDANSNEVIPPPILLTGDFSRNRLKFFDQLEKSTPFTFSLKYLFQMHLELFSSLVFKLFLQENLSIVEEADSGTMIELCPLISFRKYVKPAQQSNYVSVPTLLQLTDQFKGILACLFERFQYDESGFQLVHGLVYYSMVFGIVYGAEELFSTCFDLAKRYKHEMTRHLLLQFAIYYHGDHILDWYPILETTVEFPERTECIYQLVEDMSLATLESFINGFCLLSFDSNSTDDIDTTAFRFLLSKGEQIFVSILGTFHNQSYCSVFRALLFHLVSLTYNKDEVVKQESMKCLVRIVSEFCSEFQDSELPANYQTELIDAFAKVLDSSCDDNRIAAYESLQSTLHVLGKRNLSSAWDKIIECINSCHREGLVADSSSTASAAALRHFKVKACAFECLQIIVADFSHSMPAKYHRAVLDSLSAFIARQDDVNTSLTAVEFLWKFADHLIEVENVQEWMAALRCFLEFGCESRNELRNAAIQSLFRCVAVRNPVITSEMWDKIFRDIFFPLIERLHHLEYEDSAIHSVQGLSSVVFNLMDYFFEPDVFVGFSACWNQTCDLFLQLLSSSSFSEDYFLATIKSFKSVLTGANKSIHKKERINEWEYSYKTWLKLNRDSPQRHIYQSVLCQYALCFHSLYGLLSQSELYNLAMIQEFFDNFHSLLLRPMTAKEALNDTEVMSLLQLAVMEQLSKSFNPALLPGSVDLLTIAWSRMSLIPKQVLGLPLISSYKYCTGIALSSHLLKNVLTPSVSLSSLSEDTIVTVMENVVALIQSDFYYPLKRLAIQSTQRIIAHLHQEDNPISTSIYSSLTDACLAVLEQILQDANPRHTNDYGEFLEFSRRLEIFSLFPRQFSIKLMQSINHLSLQLVTHEILAFQALALMFSFSDPAKYSKNGVADWTMQMLLERSRHGINSYTEHLFLCGSIPMINVKYREITAILSGFLQHNFSLDPIAKSLRDILLHEKRQKDVRQLVEQIVQMQ